MSDNILRSLFLDMQLWTDAIEHGVCKGEPQRILEFFQSPKCRADLCRAIGYGHYKIGVPHTGYRAKEDGGERMYLVNEPFDRILLHVIYKWLMKNESQMIHPQCLSYKEGIGIGKIVKNLSHSVSSLDLDCTGRIVGQKFDIHKYFESVPCANIHKAFDRVEEHYGKSSVITLLRDYYDNDEYYDSRRREYVENYSGLKQGSAVSSWLADVVLYPLDVALSQQKGLYLRYSDDIIYIGIVYIQASEVITRHLDSVGLKLNDKKTENVRAQRFVRFLGYNIKGTEITLSKKWVKNFQRQINRLTIKNVNLIRRVRKIRRSADDKSKLELDAIFTKVQRSVARFLYYGDGRFSWANHVLGVVNRGDDIFKLHIYCLDAIRAVYTGKTNIGGLGVSLESGIIRGKGRHVAENLKKVPDFACGYISLNAMQQVVSNKWLYRTVVNDIISVKNNRLYSANSMQGCDRESFIRELEHRYERFLNSEPDEKKFDRFYARQLNEMMPDDLILAPNRSDMRNRLEEWLEHGFSYLFDESKPEKWFWQSSAYPQFVVLRSWYESERHGQLTVKNKGHLNP